MSSPELGACKLASHLCRKPNQFTSPPARRDRSAFLALVLAATSVAEKTVMSTIWR